MKLNHSEDTSANCHCLPELWLRSACFFFAIVTIEQLWMLIAQIHSVGLTRSHGFGQSTSSQKQAAQLQREWRGRYALRSLPMMTIPFTQAPCQWVKCYAFLLEVSEKDANISDCFKIPINRRVDLYVYNEKLYFLHVQSIWGTTWGRLTWPEVWHLWILGRRQICPLVQSLWCAYQWEKAYCKCTCGAKPSSSSNLLWQEAWGI